MTPEAVLALANGDMKNFMAASLPGGIEAQEAAGQADFVANETLPKDMRKGVREELEKVGVVFGEPVDKLFLAAKLPNGWRKVPTDHSMWSKLVDEKCRTRAMIFYKAAFYDMSAHINLTQRFSVSNYHEVSPVAIEFKKTHYDVVVTDCEAVIHRVGMYEQRDYSAGEKLYNEAKAWLEGQYPNWQDATAYWD